MCFDGKFELSAGQTPVASVVNIIRIATCANLDAFFGDYIFHFSTDESGKSST